MKNNKYIVLGFVIITLIILYSFYGYIDSKNSQKKYYNEVKEKCLIEKKTSNILCSSFTNENGKINIKQLNKYINEINPNSKQNKTDVITLSSTIIQLSFFKNLQLFSPLLIILIVVATFHNEFSSGNFENSLCRVDFKKYLKKKYLKSRVIALIMPFSIILIFILSCLITSFNFNSSYVYKYLAVYDQWKYNNFFIYECAIILIQYFISLLYVNIGLFSILKNKNKIISVIMGYIYFIIIYLFIYAGLYALVINKFLGIKEVSDYFNIAGYWFFNDGPNWLIVIILSIIFSLISFAFIYKKYTNKERIVLLYEEKE